MYSYGLFQDYRGDWTGSSNPEILSRSHTEEDAVAVRYNVLGQREMIVYYPFIEYKTYRNDLTLLLDAEGGQLAEIAISLDDYYCITQIDALFPQELIAWY